MNKFILILCLFTTPVFADWFQVQDLYLEGKKFTGRGNDSINAAIGRQEDKGLSLGLNINFLDYFFFSNKIDARSGCISGEECQFSEVSYNFTTGMHLFPWLDLNYNHYSGHALDNPYNYDVEDYIGFRLYLINSDKNNSLFR